MSEVCETCNRSSDAPKVITCRECMEDIDQACRRYNDAKCVAEKQADDSALWAVTKTSTELYLQRALRRLTAAIEGES